MSLQGKVKRKLAKLERVNNNLHEIEQEREKIQESLKYMDELEHDLKHEMDHIEDYFIDHYVEAKSYIVEVIKGQLIEVVVGYVGTTTYAAFNGIVCSAKTHPDDEYVKEIGETIAIQRLINVLLEMSFGFKL